MDSYHVDVLVTLVLVEEDYQKVMFTSMDCWSVVIAGMELITERITKNVKIGSMIETQLLFATSWDSKVGKLLFLAGN